MGVPAAEFFSDTIAIFTEALVRATAERQKAGKAGRLSLFTLMTQGALETGWQPLGCAAGYAGWRGHKNYSGISYNGVLANFATTSDYASAYATAINQAFYDSVWTADGGSGQLTALGKSPWSASHYGNPPGADLIAIYNANLALMRSSLNQSLGNLENAATAIWRSLMGGTGTATLTDGTLAVLSAEPVASAVPTSAEGAANEVAQETAVGADIMTFARTLLIGSGSQVSLHPTGEKTAAGDPIYVIANVKP